MRRAEGIHRHYIGCIVITLALIAAISLPPNPDRYVTDSAGVLSPQRQDVLNARLETFERTTSKQILVYVGRRLPLATTIEEFAGEAMHRWSFGPAGKDNNVAILFVFPIDQKVRIEVGYGLRRSLTSAKTNWIITNVITPEFRHRDYGVGIEEGTAAMLRIIRGEPFAGSGRTAAEVRSRAIDVKPWLPLLAIVGSILLIFGNALLRWVHQLLEGSAGVTIPSPRSDPMANWSPAQKFGCLLAAVFLPLIVLGWLGTHGVSAFWIFVLLVLGTALVPRIVNHFYPGFIVSVGGGSTGFSGGSSGGGSSGGSSSSSSGGFSGGGGSGGGGGASGSW